MIRLRRLFPLFAVWVCSCASVTVERAEVAGPVPSGDKPEKIFVRPFEFHEPGLRVDRTGAQRKEVKEEFIAKFSKQLARRLEKHVAPTEVVEAVEADAVLPAGNHWVISGRFDRANQGSRMLRGIVGLGAGGTKLETTAFVRSLATDPPENLLEIETTGGSNISPGVLGVGMFFFSGPTALMSLGHAIEAVLTGLTYDGVRTSREITAVISEYLANEGHVPEKESLVAKRPGKFTNITNFFRRTPAPPADEDEGSGEDSDGDGDAS